MYPFPLFPRLFQVIVRIDDCLALLNLVSRGVGDVSVTQGRGGGVVMVPKGTFLFFFFGFILKIPHMQESSEFLGVTRDLKTLLDFIRVLRNRIFSLSGLHDADNLPTLHGESQSR